MLKKSRTKIKKELLPAIAEMISKNFKRDQNDFTTFFPKLDQKLYMNFLNLIKQVKRLPNPITVTRELYHYIEEMHEYLISISPLLDNPDLNSADNANHPIHDIITSLRNRIQHNDVHGTIRLMDKLILEVKSIIVETDEQFFSQDILKNLITHRNNLVGDHTTIKTLLEKRSSLVDKNEKIRDQLREEISRISKAGKNMYRMMKPEKINDYDIQKLILKRKHIFKES